MTNYLVAQANSICSVMSFIKSSGSGRDRGRGSQGRKTSTLKTGVRENSVFCSILGSGPQIRVHNKKLFSYFSTKTYVVGTQKNRLDETVLLSTQNTC